MHCRLFSILLRRSGFYTREKNKKTTPRRALFCFYEILLFRSCKLDFALVCFELFDCGTEDDVVNFNIVTSPDVLTRVAPRFGFVIAFVSVCNIVFSAEEVETETCAVLRPVKTVA